MKIYKKSVLFLMVLLCVAVGTGWAFDGMVTRVEDSGIVINRGSRDQVTPGTILYVTRMQRPIGKIQIVGVDEFSSLCKSEEIVAGETFRVGDLISTDPYKKVDTDNSNYDSRSNSTESSSSNTVSSESGSIYDRYKKALEKRVHVFQIKRGAGGHVKITPYHVLNLATPLMYGGGTYFFNGWTGAYMALDMYSAYQSTSNPNNVRNIQVEVSYWDSMYLDAFVEYYALKNSITDPIAINEMKQNIIQQKGMNQFYVFQIKIVNQGPGAVQISPFNSHFYMIGNDGSTIVADNYDNVLDNALNPNQVVNGYVYFSKTDMMGQAKVDDKLIKVKFLDILGKTQEIYFNK